MTGIDLRAALQGRIGLQCAVQLLHMAAEDLVVVRHYGGSVQVWLQSGGGVGQPGERIGEGHGQRILSE